MDYSTAIHEAGHAVVGRVLRLPCGGATIEAQGNAGGHAKIGDTWRIVDAWWGDLENPGTRPHGTTASGLRASLLYFMAGWAAERMIIGECQDGDRDDRHQIMLMLGQLDIPGRREPGDWAWDHYESRLRLRSCGLVRRHHLPIERVAAGLMSRCTLSAQEIDAFVLG